MTEQQQAEIVDLTEQQQAEIMNQIAEIFEAWVRADYEERDRLLNGLFELAEIINPVGMSDAFHQVLFARAIEYGDLEVAKSRRELDRKIS